MIPEWLEIKENDGKVNEIHYVNGDLLYPFIIAELEKMRDAMPEKENELPWEKELRSFDADNLDQYWIEVIYQMGKLEHQRALMMAGINHWPQERRIQCDKTEWALKLYPAGRGVHAASKGKEARELYKKLRGFIPN